MKVPSPSLLGCEFLALAVARINHSLALRARIFSKQKSKPSNTSPTRKRVVRPPVGQRLALCQRRVWPLRPPRACTYRCLLAPPKSGRDGEAGEGAESKALKWRNVGKRALPRHSCLVSDPPRERVIEPSLNVLRQDDHAKRSANDI